MVSDHRETRQLQRKHSVSRAYSTLAVNDHLVVRTEADILKHPLQLSGRLEAMTGRIDHIAPWQVDCLGDVLRLITIALARIDDAQISIVQ